MEKNFQNVIQLEKKIDDDLENNVQKTKSSEENFKKDDQNDSLINDCFSNETKGRLIVLFGVLWLSPDALMVKLVESENIWLVIFLRYHGFDFVFFFFLIEE